LPLEFPVLIIACVFEGNLAHSPFTEIVHQRLCAPFIVEVTAAQDDASLLTVSFTRAQMNKVRFAFIDPVEFVTDCGENPV